MPPKHPSSPALSLFFLAAAAASVAAALLFVPGLASPQIRPVHASLSTQIEGHFTEGSGWYPGKPFVTASPVRAWGSWTGSDAHTGSLALGPFRSTDRVRFGVSGYPTRGIELHVEHAATRERRRILQPDIGERWVVAECVLPPSWQGELVSLIAIDRGQDVGGWVGLTEPIRGDRGDGATGMWISLLGAVIAAGVLGSLWLASAAMLARIAALPPQWLPLGAAAAVATLGYLGFWAWFAHPLLGKSFSVAVTIGAVVILWRLHHRAAIAHSPEQSRALRDVAKLGATICILYLGALHLFPSSLDFYGLSANRFRHSLPIDNLLPFHLAVRLDAGESPRIPGADWLSSDRPPLQTGWHLLVLPFTDALAVEREAASGTTAVWFQLLWVAGAYGLLRTVGLNSARTVGWTAVLSLSGFFLQHTLFTWPKLSAAAFASGAFALLFSRSYSASPNLPLSASAPLSVSQLSTLHSGLVWPAAFAALGWLSHGGVAFSYLVLVPWILWRCLRGEWRAWLGALTLFVVFAAPWFAYQKLYDPPGNRLMKWHLAGQIDKDARGTWQTIRENYSARSWREIADYKHLNFARQVGGNWAQLFEFTPAGAVERRNEEFYYLGRGFTWWSLGLLALPFVLLGARAAPMRPAVLMLAAWFGLTLPVWCLLMFSPASAIPHQASYAMILGGFVLFSACLELVSHYSLLLIAGLQAATFCTTWLAPNPIVGGSPQPLALGLMLAAGAMLARLIACAHLSPRSAEEANPAKPASPSAP